MGLGIKLLRNAFICNALHFRRLKFGCSAVCHTPLLSQLYSFATAFLSFLSSFHSFGLLRTRAHYTMLHSSHIFAFKAWHMINTQIQLFTCAHTFSQKLYISLGFRDSELRNPFKEALRKPAQLYSCYARLAVCQDCGT